MPSGAACWRAPVTWSCSQHPRIAAIVHRVVHQRGVTLHRDATARGSEVGLGGDGILLITQLITNVGEQLRQHDALIGGTSSLPVRHELTQPIEQQTPEASVVLGEIVDLRRFGRVRRTAGDRRAVELARALHLEREFDLGELGIEDRWSSIVGAERTTAGICDSIACGVGTDDERPVLVRERRQQACLLGGEGGRCGLARLGPLDLHILDAIAAAQPQVDGRDAGDRLEKVQEQRSLAELVAL